MSITFKNITLRNFLSIGAVCQAVNFDTSELTLILGENIDLGGDGARNGTGKTTLIQGLSYVLFGSPINQIRKDNLINRTNAKNMMVTLEFSSNGIDYKIERGRKPHILRFYVNNNLQNNKEDKNEAQGENKETQLAIEHAIGMTPDMFKHIVALNTYSEPFLSMKANDQRNVIEQLLGITLLSEKADLIKEKIRLNKDNIQQEEFRNKAVEEANKRVQEQIDSLKRRQRLWEAKHKEDLELLALRYDELSKIDITNELQSHYDLKIYEANKVELNNINSTINRLETTLKKETAIVSKLEAEIKTLEDNKCYACGQDFHDENHSAVINSKRELLATAVDDLVQTQNELEKNKNSLFILGEKPTTHYETEAEAIEHKTTVANLLQQIENKTDETDPYQEQIVDMENQALQEVTFDKINELTKYGDHLKFLLDILTSKDSFVRKKIIDQNLSYLNARLTHYLDKIGLPHTVVFKNDLSVEITELGRELDFDNLSRGERNRLILGLSFAFRDVWENLYFPINTLFIDELIDSGMDSIGVENSMAILKDMSRRRNKSIWLVSHREELAGRVPSVLKVVKENGFTTYNTAADIE
jgi:DNA repair exonuclease SbcCD ATPase subunit